MTVAGADGDTNADVGKASFYLVTSNVNGKRNLGTFLRTASAFGVTQVLVVGSARFGTHGAHRAQKHVDTVLIDDFLQAQAYLRSRNCEIVGIHSGLLPLQKHGSSSSSVAVHLQLFQPAKNVAFVIDNEVVGFSDDQKAICDRFVHVEFPMASQLLLTATTCSIDSATAATGCCRSTADEEDHEMPARTVGVNERLDLAMVLGIVLHHFTTWARYSQRAMHETSSQGKFIVDTKVIGGADASVGGVCGSEAGASSLQDTTLRALAKGQHRMSHRQAMDQVLELQPFRIETLFDEDENEQ